MRRYSALIFLQVSVSVMIAGCDNHDGLEDYKYRGTFSPGKNAVQNEFGFNGFTYYWHGDFKTWTSYGNLFKTTSSAPESAIARSRFDIAGDLGIQGLSMQEGFVNALLAGSYATLEQPSIEELKDSLKSGNVLVIIDPTSEVGRKLSRKYIRQDAAQVIRNDNTDSSNRVDAFMLENGSRRIFVVSSVDKQLTVKLEGLLKSTAGLLENYDLRRGWFGAQTLLKSVTNTPGHPLEVIGKGMNEGNSWFVFDGYMEFLSKQEIRKWLDKVNLPIVTDVGFTSSNYPPIYGCQSYDTLQVQSLFMPSAWVNYAHSNKGYVFRQVYDTVADRSSLAYDGYVATEGNKEQIDRDSLPFVSSTGTLESGAVPSMVLFVKKDDKLTAATLWEAILQRREVSVLENGKMMGPALYRNALELLLLDRVFLEEYFGDRVSIDAHTKDYQLNVTVKNTYAHEVSGQFSISVPSELKLAGDSTLTLSLPANSTKTLSFKLEPTAEAMNNTNPIAVHYHWGTIEKSTLAMLDLPPAISVYRLLYAHAPIVKYPVTIHNFTSNTSFPVKVEVLDSNQTSKAVFETQQTCTTGTASFKEMTFDLPVSAGNYFVKVTALGVENISQLGVGAASGSAKITEVDLNHDGISEYKMENDSVQATLLTTGARVIEYIVKSKKDNILFKLWPDKPIDDRRSFRRREFYPYGGFEDFLGQPSIETDKQYDAVVVKKEGDYVQVKMKADYFGNIIEKTFTLYGNSPLLEIRFALTFKNPELNMIGPQPILSIGEKHGPEDVFFFPEINGLHHYRMDPEKYYGRIIHLKEGWNAGYDSKENISFVGAFPVDQPLFLHMWMNHPSNPGSHYFYAELQPWTPIFQKSTTYFSYYLWGSGGPWEKGVRALRDRNLVTIKK